ncbi:MAG: hypothetical protein NVSMB31_17140 [Vulcanimicrobiaceae bacterium]
MKRAYRALAVACMLLTVACQGSFGSGPQIPGTINPPGNGVPTQQPANASPGPLGSAAAAKSQSFALADAAKGIPCPESGGFGCTLRFNIPASSPTPSASPATGVKPGKGSPLPSPTPSPSPSPSPSPVPSPSSNASPKNSESPAASASPSGATLELQMTALPKDAPQMVITKKGAPATKALIRISLIPSDDFTLDGPAEAIFTLPKEEISDRGFAIQLFEETVHKKRHDMKALFTLAKSTIDKQKLTFDFLPPKMTLPKGHHYYIILYGDDRPNPTPAPSTSGSPAGDASGPSAAPVAPPRTPVSPGPTGSPLDL